METAFDTELPLMTAEEFFDWANRPERSAFLYELDNGRAKPMPSPGELHGLLCFLITNLLTAYVLPRGGYLLLNDTGFIVGRLPDSVRGPDIMLFLKNQKYSAFSTGHCQRIPDLIVEIFSPHDRPGKLNKRVHQFLDAGVSMVWVVYPEDRTVNVYTAKESPRVFDETEELTGEGVLPDFRCKVSEFFTLPGSNDEPQTTTP